MRIVIANSNPSTRSVFQKLTDTFDIKFINQQEDLTVDSLNNWSPTYVFFPHWSYIIPESIFTHFECVVFHMTDLPFGRGGSPLQNLITRGFTETKISALKVNKGIDTGDIYLKTDLSLCGKAEEIYSRAAKNIYKMILEIANNKITPQKQEGEAVFFKRRTPSESNIQHLESPKKIFDTIRMLDAPNYPKAFLKTDNFILEFSDASLQADGSIKAEVIFKSINDAK